MYISENDVQFNIIKVEINKPSHTYMYVLKQRCNFLSTNIHVQQKKEG